LRGRLVVTEALVLSSRPFREADRVCTLYTLDYGKLQARFVSVDRPMGKLKALAEPLTLAEHRLHIRSGAESAVAAGGAVATVFPRLRQDLGLTLRGLQVLELLDRLTPYWSPSPEKFRLAKECLHTLQVCVATDGSDATWLVGAFGLRLLEAAGFGMGQRRVSEKNRALWDSLHEAPFERVLALPPDPALQARLESFIRKSVEALIQQPLRVPGVQRDILSALKRGLHPIKQTASAPVTSPRDGHAPARAEGLG
jgi:hypothetical protein